jgi:7,8-dihydropterin-6-yl-methyl-4-(beta-D-ribofuranosyl)aminobenzene 5'-phosphate synthase
MVKTEDVKITTLAENSTADSRMLAEWGLSVLVEAGAHTFLLDAGTTDVAVRNADTLGIDLDTIEAIVLSHGHFDHTGGLLPVLERMARSEVRIIAHPDATAKKYVYKKEIDTYKYAGIPYALDRLTSAGARFQFSKEPVWLTDDIAASGEEPMTTAFESVADNLCLKGGERYIQDPMTDDQSLYIRTDRGLIIILGCAHRGMTNIIRHARKVMETDRVYMVIGGTHLGPAPSEQLEQSIEALREIDAAWLGVSHCTGLPAAVKLAREFEGRFFFNTAGKVITFPFSVS